MMKRLIGTITLILMMTGLCACSAQPLSTAAEESTPVPAPTVATVLSSPPVASTTLSPETMPTPFLPNANAYRSDQMLSIATDVIEAESNFLVLPRVMNGIHEQYYNQCISSLVEDALTEVNRSVFADYSIETHNDEILSIALRLYDLESGMPCGIYPITFDLTSAQVRQLSDYFNADDDRWRRILPDIVTQQSEKRGITLLSELLPISDEQAFYIQGDALVLVYHPYEIATYDAGVPEFAIPISGLETLLREGCPLTKLISDDAAEVIYETETAGKTEK